MTESSIGIVESDYIFFHASYDHAKATKVFAGVAIVSKAG